MSLTFLEIEPVEPLEIDENEVITFIDPEEINYNEVFIPAIDALMDIKALRQVRYDE